MLSGKGVALVVALAALTLPGAALAAYPGENGRIVFATGSGLSTINPDGTGQAQLTTGADVNPSWSPDGRRVAFVRRTPTPCSPCALAVHVVNADGTGDTAVTSPLPNEVEQPTWSSDGTRIAFTVRAGGQNDIWAVGADGSGLTQVTATADDEVHASWSPDGRQIAFGVNGSIFSVRPDGTDRRLIFAGGDEDGYYAPDWSPDGQRIALVVLYLCDGDTCQSIVTRRVDGSGGTFVIGSGGDFTAHFDRPSWSPDGTRIALAGLGFTPRVFTISPTGTGRLDTGVQGSQPDWQPLPVDQEIERHVRPKGATPFRVPLVPAYGSCTSPNREHGPPLAFGSCNPPQPASSRLTIGVGDGSPAFARGSGFVRLDVRPGAAGAPNDADVLIRFSLTNVMRTADLSEYTGSLRAEMTVRRTDNDVGPDIGGPAVGPRSTSMDFPFAFAAPCVPTPGSSLDASTCTTSTSVNALVPNALWEVNRNVWALEALRVYDGGPDEDADTEGDNSLFMTQGVFVP